MISVYNIKPQFQKLLRPVLSGLYKSGISANMITAASILFSLIVGIVLWLHPYGLSYLLLPLFLLFRMALNALDGMMARTYNMQSRTGEVLNEAGDVLSDLFLFLPLIIMFPISIYLYVTFLLLMVINEFTGLLGKAVTGIRRYDGPMGKSDRAFVVGLFSLIMFFADISAYTNYLFLGMNLLLIVSSFVRCYKAIKT